MSQMAKHWTAASAGSVLVHLAVSALLLWSLQPTEILQQNPPESSLTLAAHQVPRSRAEAQQATSEAIPESQQTAEGLGTSAAPLTKAPPLSLPSQTLPHRQDFSEKISTAAPALPTSQTQTLPTEQVIVKSPPPEEVAAILPSTTSIADTEASATSVVISLPQSGVLTASAIETTEIAAGPADSQSLTAETHAAPQATLLSPTLNAATLPNSPPQSETLALTPPKSEQVTAALAFQGETSGELDPLSLAVFQSFTQPGDLPDATENVRDGLSAMLASVPCSRLQVSFNPDTASLELRGHLPEEGLRTPVMSALQQMVGQDIQLSDRVRLLPRPQCGALSGISSVGLPQSTDQITNPLLLGPDAQARVLAYAGGERLYFDLTAPDYPAYIYVDFFDAGGSVLHLSPNQIIPLQRTQEKQPLRVGAKNEGDPGLQITVGPPYGQEIAVAFAASVPLYEGHRPISEPAGAYLEFLHRQVATARRQHEDFKGEWVYFLIETNAP